MKGVDKINILNKRKHKKIQDIFNISNIKEEYVEIDKKYKIYLFEIQPIHIISISEYEENNIINKYKEFLKGMDIDFNIYIENEKVNILDYYKVIDNNKNNELLNKYKESLEKSINLNNIYNSRFYVLIKLKLNQNIQDVLEKLNLLNEIGNRYYMIKGKNQLKEFIYNRINKVSYYE